MRLCRNSGVGIRGVAVVFRARVVAADRADARHSAQRRELFLPDAAFPRDQEKEKVRKGEISSGEFYAYVVGVFTSELYLFFNNRFNTDLD